jgi:hypothetical protein
MPWPINWVSHNRRCHSTFESYAKRVWFGVNGVVISCTIRLIVMDWIDIGRPYKTPWGTISSQAEAYF